MSLCEWNQKPPSLALFRVGDAICIKDIKHFALRNYNLTLKMQQCAMCVRY